MENKDRIRKTVGSTRTRSKYHAPGKDNTLKRLPLRQLQIHALSPKLLAGEKKTRGEDVKQVPKAAGNQTDVSCQTDVPPQAGSSNPWEMCTAERPPEKYWEIMAERRRLALAEALQENIELHKEVKKLKETVKELEAKNSDAEYFAMMYSITRPTLTADT